MKNETDATLLFIMHDRPNYPGGPIVNYLRLLPRLIQHGYVAHLLAFYHEDCPNAKALQAQGVIIHPKQVSGLFSQEITEWILAKAEEIQPDIFIPDVSTPGCFAGKWIKQSGIPVINAHRSFDETNMGRAVYFSDPQTAYVSTGIVCVSQYLRDSLLEKVNNPALLTKVIPSGVEIPEYSARQESQPFRIAYAGRLVEKQKQITQTLEAFIVLGQKQSDIQFTLIGDGPERGRCQQLIEQAGMQDRIQITGFLVGEDYKQELAKHHVIVLLSDYEGVPGAIMDGMSCGLIPICTDYAGVRELVADGKNGYIVADRGRSFFQAVELLYSDKELRKRLSYNARQHIIKNFSIDTAVELWQAFFAECQAVAGPKQQFQSPDKITLPPPSPLLIEYTVKPPFLIGLLQRVQFRARMKRIFFCKSP